MSASNELFHTQPEWLSHPIDRVLPRPLQTMFQRSVRSLRYVALCPRLHNIVWEGCGEADRGEGKRQAVPPSYIHVSKDGTRQDLQLCCQHPGTYTEEHRIEGKEKTR